MAKKKEELSEKEQFELRRAQVLGQSAQQKETNTSVKNIIKDVNTQNNFKPTKAETKTLNSSVNRIAQKAYDDTFTTKNTPALYKNNTETTSSAKRRKEQQLKNLSSLDKTTREEAEKELEEEYNNKVSNYATQAIDNVYKHSEHYIKERNELFINETQKKYGNILYDEELPSFNYELNDKTKNKLMYADLLKKSNTKTKSGNIRGSWEDDSKIISDIIGHKINTSQTFYRSVMKTLEKDPKNSKYSEPYEELYKRVNKKLDDNNSKISMLDEAIHNGVDDEMMLSNLMQQRQQIESENNLLTTYIAKTKYVEDQYKQEYDQELQKEKAISTSWKVFKIDLSHIGSKNTAELIGSFGTLGQSIVDDAMFGISQSLSNKIRDNTDWDESKLGNLVTTGGISTLSSAIISMSPIGPYQLALRSIDDLNLLLTKTDPSGTHLYGKTGKLQTKDDIGAIQVAGSIADLAWNYVSANELHGELWDKISNRKPIDDVDVTDFVETASKNIAKQNKVFNLEELGKQLNPYAKTIIGQDMKKDIVKAFFTEGIEETIQTYTEAMMEGKSTEELLSPEMMVEALQSGLIGGIGGSATQGVGEFFNYKTNVDNYKKQVALGYAAQLGELETDITTEPQMLTKTFVNERLANGETVVIMNNDISSNEVSTNYGDGAILVVPNHSSETYAKSKYPNATVIQLDPTSENYDKNLSLLMDNKFMNNYKTFGYSYNENIDRMDVEADYTLNNLVKDINNYDLVEKVTEQIGENAVTGETLKSIGKLTVKTNSITNNNLNEIRQDLTSQVNTLLENGKITSEKATSIIGKIATTIDGAINNKQSRGRVVSNSNGGAIFFKKTSSNTYEVDKTTTGLDGTKIEEEGLPVKVYGKNILEGTNGFNFKTPEVEQLNYINNLLKIFDKSDRVNKNISSEGFIDLVKKYADTSIPNSDLKLGQLLLNAAGYDGVLYDNENSYSLYSAFNNNDSDNTDKALLNTMTRNTDEINNMMNQQKTFNKELLNKLRLENNEFVFNEDGSEFTITKEHGIINTETGELKYENEKKTIKTQDVIDGKVIFLDENGHRVTNINQKIETIFDTDDVFDVETEGKNLTFETERPISLVDGTGKNITVKLKLVNEGNASYETIVKDGVVQDGWVLTKNKGAIVNDISKATSAVRTQNSLKYGYFNPLTMEKAINTNETSQTKATLKELQNQPLNKDNENRTYQSATFEVTKTSNKNSNTNYVETMDKPLNVVPSSLYSRTYNMLSEAFMDFTDDDIQTIVNFAFDNSKDMYIDTAKIRTNVEEFAKSHSELMKSNPNDAAQLFMEEVLGIDGYGDNKKAFDKAIQNKYNKYKKDNKGASFIDFLVDNYVERTAKQLKIDPEKVRTEIKDTVKYAKMPLDLKMNNVSEMDVIANNDFLSEAYEELYHSYQSEKKHSITELAESPDFLAKLSGVKNKNIDKSQNMNSRQTQDFETITLNNTGLSKINYKSDNFYDSARIVKTRDTYSAISEKANNMKGLMEFKTNPELRKSVVDLALEYYRNPRMLNDIGVSNEEFDGLLKKLIPSKVLSLMNYKSDNIKPENRWYGPLNMYASINSNDIDKDIPFTKSVMEQYIKSHNIVISDNILNNKTAYNKLCNSFYNIMLFFDGHYDSELLSNIDTNDMFDETEFGAFTPTLKKLELSLDEDLLSEDVESTLSHELGHLADAELMKNILGTEFDIRTVSEELGELINNTSIASTAVDTSANRIKNKQLPFDKELDITRKLINFSKNIQQTYDAQIKEKYYNKLSELEKTLSEEKNKKQTKKQQEKIDELQNTIDEFNDNLDYVYTSPNETFARFINTFYEYVKSAVDENTLLTEDTNTKNGSLKFGVENAIFEDSKLGFTTSQFDEFRTILEDINELKSQRDMYEIQQEKIKTSPNPKGSEEINPEIKNYAQKQGYDSIIYENKQHTSTITPLDRQQSRIWLIGNHFQNDETVKTNSTNKDFVDTGETIERDGKVYKVTKSQNEKASTKKEKQLKMEQNPNIEATGIVNENINSTNVNEALAQEAIKNAGYKSYKTIDETGQEKYVNLNNDKTFNLNDTVPYSNVDQSTMLFDIVDNNGTPIVVSPVDAISMDETQSENINMVNSEMITKDEFKKAFEDYKKLLGDNLNTLGKEQQSMLQKLWNKFRILMVTRDNPITKVAYRNMYKLKENAKVTGQVVLNNLFRLRTGADRISHNNLYYNQTDFDGSIIEGSKGLNQIKKGINKQDRKLFSSWWRLNENVEIFERYSKTHKDANPKTQTGHYNVKGVEENGNTVIMTIEQQKAEIERISKNHPEFLKVAEELKQFNINQNKVLKSAGMLSYDTGNNLASDNEYLGYNFYAPAYYNDKSTKELFIDRDMWQQHLNTDNTIHKLEDGGVDIDNITDVFDAFTRREYIIRKQTAQNELIKSMALNHQYDYEGPNGGSLEYYVGGKKLTLHTTMDIASALGYTGLEADINNTLNNPIGKFIKKSKSFASFLWTGAAYSDVGQKMGKLIGAGFQIANVIRDFQDGRFNSRQWFAIGYTYNYLRGIYAIATKNKYYDLAVKAGLIQEYNNNPLSTFEYLETLPKMSEFIYNINNNVDPLTAAERSQSVNLNFDISGTLIKPINSWITLYTNASIQGIDQFVKTNKRAAESPAEALKLAIKYGEYLGCQAFNNLINGAIVSGLGSLFDDDDEEEEKKKTKKQQNYEKISDYTKRNNFIIFYNDTDYIKIPKGRYQAFVSTLSRITNIGSDNYDGWDYADEVISSIKDNMSVTAETLPFASMVKSLAENKNPLTGNNIYTPHFVNEKGKEVKEEDAYVDKEAGVLKPGITENKYYDTPEQKNRKRGAFLLAQLGGVGQQLSKIVDDDKRTIATPLGVITQRFSGTTKYTPSYTKKQDMTTKREILKANAFKGDPIADAKYKAASLAINNYYAANEQYYNNISVSKTPNEILDANLMVEDMDYIADTIINDNLYYEIYTFPRTTKYNKKWTTTNNGIAIFDTGMYYYSASQGTFTKLDTPEKQKKYKWYINAYNNR